MSSYLFLGAMVLGAVGLGAYLGWRDVLARRKREQSERVDWE
jgi:hypothetical protein